MINFIFEDINEYKNLTDSWSHNKAGSPRFTVSPLFNRLNILNNQTYKFKNIIDISHKNDTPDKYIISLGVNNDPSNWAGGKYGQYKDEGYPSIFELLSDEYIKDLQNDKAFLLIDSSFEGYHEEWIFNFFHDECERYDIKPSRIIFVTGNSIIEDCYYTWIVNNPRTDKIKVLPYSAFEFDVYQYSQDLPEGNITFPPSHDEHLIYKEQNHDSIKLYNNLNKKTREHRRNFYSLLYISKLLDDGLISMNSFDNKIDFCGMKFDDSLTNKILETLPSEINDISNEIYTPDYYVKRFHIKPTLDSYVSIISEAQYEDHQDTVFLSEKIFKVIACSHPFIILGNKHSLKELRKLGYLTYSPWINEDYDESTTCERYHDIIKSIKRIKKIDDKLSWYRAMGDVIKYNKDLLRVNSIERLPYAAIELLNYYHNN